MAGIERLAIDPALAARVAHLPVSNLDDPVAARKQGEAFGIRPSVAGTAAERLTVSDATVPPDPGVPIRIYLPSDRAPAAAILWIHGGGFVRGSVEIDDPLARRAAVVAASVVVSVDYRLAPEHPFPAAVEDCYAALCWLSAHSRELGVTSERLAVAGYSAGGCLAASVALLSRDRGGPTICFQALGVPVLDDRLDTPSMATFVDTPLWNRRLAERSWEHYLGQARDEVSSYAAPGREADLRGLPPTYISTAQFDPLRDEGLAYGRRLLEAGVRVEQHQFAGAIHGSHLFPDTTLGFRLGQELFAVLREALVVDQDDNAIVQTNLEPNRS